MERQGAAAAAGSLQSVDAGVWPLSQPTVGYDYDTFAET